MYDQGLRHPRGTAAGLLAGPPPPELLEDMLRWDHTALRYRMLYGGHRPDVERYVVQAVGRERAARWQPLDLSANPFALAWEQLSALYHDEPEIVGPHPDVIAAVADSGVWPLMQRVQRDVLGLREVPLLCELDDDGQPRAHIILPHRCTVEVHPRRPGVILAAHWWELDPTDISRWIQYHVDARGTGSYTVTDANGRNITEEVLGDRASIYPWRAPDGSPVQPVVLYHAAASGMTWDPYAHIEVVEGTFHICLQYTNFGHVVRHAAWAQRWTMGVRARGADTGEGGEVQQVVADAATAIAFEPDEDAPAGSAQIGQWSVSADPEKLFASIRMNEKRLMEQAVGGVETTRSTSDIRSGASLAVSREAQILAQERYAPVFRGADRRALQVWSALLATDRGTDYPLTWAAQTGRKRQGATGAVRPERDIEYNLSSPVAGDIPTTMPPSPVAPSPSRETQT